MVLLGRSGSGGQKISAPSAVKPWVVVGRLTRADRAFRSMPDGVGSGEPTHDD